jgi:hypothetical protein
MVCRNICLRYANTKVSYLAGEKYCRRCEYFFVTPKMLFECCGIRLRASPDRREYKEKVRANKNELMDNFLVRGL